MSRLKELRSLLEEPGMDGSVRQEIDISAVRQVVEALNGLPDDALDRGWNFIAANLLSHQAEQKINPLLFHTLQLRGALAEACELLEGWISWKCAEKHRAEHMQKLAELREVGTNGDVYRNHAVTDLLEVTVRDSGGAYTTNKVQGCSASCTSSASSAVTRLAEKLFLKDAHVITVARKPGDEFSTQRDRQVWLIHAAPKAA